MKRKLTSGLLAVLVLVVWGMIGYKLWKMAMPAKEPLSIETAQLVSSSPTTHRPLILNYRDPFYDDAESETKEVVVDLKPEKNAPQFVYKGMIRAKDGIIRAIVKVEQGELKTLSRGEVLEGARIIEIDPEFVVMKWNGNHLIINVQ